MKKITLTIFLLVSFVFWGGAQQLDSIAIENAINDGLSFERERDYKAARQIYLPLVEESKTNGYNNLYAKLLLKIGVSYFRNYQLDSTIIWLERLLQEDSTLHFTDYSSVNSSFTYLGTGYSRLKEASNCIATFKKSIAYAKKVDKIQDNDVFLARAYHNMGTAMEEVGDLETGLLYLDSALFNLREKLKEPSELEAYIYTNKGNMYKKLGYFEEAITLNEQHIELFELLPKDALSNNDWGLAYWYLGSVYQQRNASEEDHLATLKHAKISEEYFLKDGSENYLLVYSYYMYAESYLQLGKYDKALYYIELAEKRNKEIYGNDFGELGYCYWIKAKISEIEGDFENALALIEKEIDLYEKLDWKNYNDVAEAWYTKGNILLKQEKPELALQAHQEGLKVLIPDFNNNVDENEFLTNPSPSQLYNNSFLFNTLQYKADAFIAYYEQEEQKEYIDKAVECFELAYNYIALSREEVVSLKTKAAFSSNKFSIYEKGIETAFKAYEITGNEAYLMKAIAFADLSKSNNLLDKLQKIQQERSLNIPAELLEEERQALSLLSFTEKELYDAKRDGTDSTKVIDLEKQLFQYQLSYEAVIENIRKDYPEYYHFSKAEQKGLDLEKLMQDSLTSELYISYFSGEKNLFVFAFNNQKLSGFKLSPLSKHTQDVGNVLNGLKRKSNQDYITAAVELYNYLLAEVLSSYDEVEKIVLIPDAEISYLPFDLLLSENPKNENNFKSFPFLIQDFEFNYHYALSLVDFKKYDATKVEDNQLKFLGFAPEFQKAQNPLLATRSATDRQLSESLERLPGALEEVRNIAELMEGEFFTGDKATEEIFKARAKEADFLHLATHTIIDDENPLYSKLVFSNNTSDKEDGLLYTYELFNMALNAEMVSLSACNTGTGKYLKGEGVVSLASGFMYAGVPNVMMTAWAVPDASTSTIMQQFYKELKDGKSKSAALRSAKLAYLNQADENLAHPYYWGAFMMIGDEKVDTNNRNTILILGGVLVAVIFLGFIMRRRKADQ